MDDTLVIHHELPPPGASMAGMAHAPGPSHARKATDSRPHDRIAAWLVLTFAGTTMVAFNMWHAIHGGIWFPLAILYGLAPVVLAMGLSHMVAAYRGGWFMKGVTFAIMVGAMVLSIRATGDVVKPASGDLWPLFGIVTDSAALLALQVILSPESRAAAKAARKTAANAEVAPQSDPAGVSVAAPDVPLGVTPDVTLAVTPEVTTEVTPEAPPVVTPEEAPVVTPKRRRIVPASATNDELAELILEHAEDIPGLNPYRVNKILKEQCNGKRVGEPRAAKLVELAQRKHRERRVVAIGERR